MSESQTPEEVRYLGLTPRQLNLGFFAVVGAIGVAIFAYFGGVGIVRDELGGDEPADSAASEPLTPTPGAPGEAPDPDAVAQAAVLTLEDLPAGWTVDAPDEDDDSDEDFEFTGECAAWNVEEFPGELASADSPDFEGLDNQQVSSTASVFENEASAQEAIDMLNSVFTKCGDQFVAAFTQGLQGEGEDRGYDTTDVSVSLQGLPFSQLGDATGAHRIAGSMTMEGVFLEFTLDFVIVRSGRVAGGITYMDFFTVDSAEEAAFAAIVAGKLADANASLTE